MSYKRHGHVDGSLEEYEMEIKQENLPEVKQSVMACLRQTERKLD